MTYHSNKIEGRAKPVVLEHGAYLRSDSSPCKRECQEREVGCKKDCEKFKKWAELHALAQEEYAQMMQSKNQAKWQHHQALTVAMGNKHRSRRK